MTKKTYVRWAIISDHQGLYTGQCCTRRDAIAEHVGDLYGVSRWAGAGLDPKQRDCWRECQAKGDRAVKVRIIVDE